MEVKKEYSNGEITVVWKPRLCFHAKECVHGLPGVFNPKLKPWIKPEAATTAELKTTIEKCPSGALSYYANEGSSPKEESTTQMAAEVEVLENGPLLVKGTIAVVHTNGTREVRERRTSFCRCGRTGNIPFCDGSHKK